MDEENIVPCDMCGGDGTIVSTWTESLGGRLTRCPKCLGKGEVLDTELRDRRTRGRQSRGRAEQRSESRDPKLGDDVQQASDTEVVSDWEDVLQDALSAAGPVHQAVSRAVHQADHMNDNPRRKRQAHVSRAGRQADHMNDNPRRKRQAHVSRAGRQADSPSGVDAAAAGLAARP